MPSRFNQSVYNPINPSKYVGTMPIVCRSSWERKVCKFLDLNPAILKWMSESIVVPYISPVDNKVHRYFTDFAVQYKTKSGLVKNVVIEVKPAAQTKPPKKQGKKKERFLQEIITYEINQAKWAAADAWCKQRNMEFWVLTEHDLGIK